MTQPWQARELPSLFGVVATAERLGRAVWVDETLFEVIGGWITDVPEAAVKERLAAHCHLHGAHAAMVRDRLPQATGIDGSSMVVAPSAGVADALARLSTPSSTVVRLAGLYRVVVPRLVAAHTFHRHATNSVTDAPTATLLDMLIGGSVSEWRDGEMMVQTLLRDASDEAARVAEISAHQAALETAIAAAGGILGPGTLGPA